MHLLLEAAGPGRGRNLFNLTKQRKQSAGIMKLIRENPTLVQPSWLCSNWGITPGCCSASCPVSGDFAKLAFSLLA
jgi:hypothetical protein